MFVLLASFTGWSQQTTIEVLDRETRRPVPYAHIHLQGLEKDYEKYLVTGDKGKAQVTLNQKVSLQVSYVGYREVTDSISPGETKTIMLSSDASNMEDVVITGQYTPERSDRSIYKINVLDNAEIKSSASNNLQEILTTELNFKINQDNVLGSSLSLQGVSGENVKILIDGVPVIGRMNGNLDLSQINLNNVERIEIVEGPMSVSYGTNALAGAINIITKDRAETGISALVSTFYESVGRYNVNAEVTHSGHSDQWRLSAGRSFFDGYSVTDTGRRHEWKPKQQWFTDLKYKRQINRLTLRTSTDFFYETVLDKGSPRLTTDTSGNYYYYRAKDGYYNTLRTGQKAFLTGMLNENSYIDLSFAYSHYKREKEMYIKNLYSGNSELSANTEDADTTGSNAWQFRGTLSRYRNRDTR
ncbi:MAG: TonB-dependent receptor plug domain-containing protein, partial [Bacteroidota bacterium]